jgi:riboflavin kinase/FMN adenylyltransferase
MKIIHLSYPLQLPITDLPEKPHTMAIGDFDGLHLGHRDVIEQAMLIAKEANITSSIMTFDPHPREVLGQSQYSRYLAPPGEKMKLFEQLGVDYTFIVSFDTHFAKVSPEDFVNHMLFQLQVHSIVVGFDFTFGHKGRGTVETLKELCRDQMHVEVVKPYNLDGYKVSSTFIREQLHLGRLDRVLKFLGRNYSITGHVVYGEGRGRTIGFHTANIDVSARYVIPRNGVYAVKVYVGQKLYKGVMNIGVKPTFREDNTNPTLEVHILDFNQDIYGQEIKVEFITFLRNEEKFASVDKLIEQIKHDVIDAKNAINE